jgi:hypothetical protein
LASKVRTRSTSIGGASPLPRAATRRASSAGLGDRVQAPCQDAARLLDVEVGLGDRQQGLVFGGLDVDLPRAHQLALRQRGIDGVGQGEDHLGAATSDELVARAGNQVAGQQVLKSTVVPLVIDAGDDGRQPQDMSLLVQPVLRLDRGAGQRDQDRPGIRQPQGRGQVDRQRAIDILRPGRRQLGRGLRLRSARGRGQGGRQPFHGLFSVGRLRWRRLGSAQESQDTQQDGGRKNGVTHHTGSLVGNGTLCALFGSPAQPPRRERATTSPGLTALASTIGTACQASGRPRGL